uniref:Helicase C-terminal domain-containing protein n=1 Tax=Panagrolaimus sp. ES5 TaxID=591445 RepID=A0AC34GNH1_9BILA
MDNNLIQDSDELKSIHDRFWNRIKPYESEEKEEIKTKKVEAIVSNYLNTKFKSNALPKRLRKVLNIGEKPFKLPRRDKFYDVMKKEADKLVRIKLAELAQDSETLKSVEGFEDDNAAFQYTDEDTEKLKDIQKEINAELRAEFREAYPEVLHMKYWEPRNNEKIAYNSEIVENFLAEVEYCRNGARYPELDLKDTFEPAYEPTIDPISFIPGFTVQNLFVIDKIPVVDDNGAILDIEDVWEQPLDPVVVENLMKHGSSDISMYHMKGNGLEVPLGLNVIEKVAPHLIGDDQEDKYTDIKVLLSIRNDTTGETWPQIIELVQSKNGAESTVVSAPVTAPAVYTDIFELMNYIHEIPPPKPTHFFEAVHGSEDISSFKKKKKQIKLIEPAPATEFVKTLQIEDAIKKAAESKLGMVGFEYAEMLDIDSNIAEYDKIKDNLARTFPFELDAFQKQAVVAMENGHSVFVAAHTSAGKTVVAEYAIALCRKHRSRRIKNRKIYVVQTLHRPVPLVHHLYSGKDRVSQNDLFEIMGPDGEINFTSLRNYNDAREAHWPENDNENVAKYTNDISYLSQDVDRSHYITLIHFLRNRRLLPAVVFIFSRDRCNKYARLLYRIDLTTADEKAAVRQLFIKYLDAFQECDRTLPQIIQMQELCHRGFAIHHSGILPVLKELVEILFQRGYVKFLFATETFAIGVNMPAKTVIFDSLEKFDGISRRSLNCTEYIQMAGRAGRRGIDERGMVIILSKGGDAYDLSSLLPMLKGEAISLESKFRITYNMLLNIIRAEQLNIEDMLQRSYVERVSLRALSSKNEKIVELKEKLDALPSLSCPDCTEVEKEASIDQYYNSLMEYFQKRGYLLNKLITTSDAGEQIFPGRYLLICYPQKDIACMLVCVQSFINTTYIKELNVIAFEIPRGRRIREVGYDLLNDEDKFKEKQGLLFEYSIKHGLEKLTDNGQTSDQLELIRNVPFENIIAICNAKFNNLNVKEVIEHLGSVTSRYHSPTQYIINLMTEMDMLMKRIIFKTEENLLFEIGKELTTSDPELNVEICEFIQLRKRLTDNNTYLCRQCVDFDAHIRLVHERKVLEAEYTKLKFQTSFGALALTDNYINCIKVLKELNFIDKDNILTIKGRVAAQINEDTVFLTELIFENKFQHRTCSEIAAMISPLIAQHNFSRNKETERICKIKTKHPELCETINKLKKEIAEMANKIDQIEGKHNVVHARNQDLTFGLMEVVYQWAEGKPFNHIVRLTHADEGAIVRCIQRLDDVLKDIRNAGRIIGDNTLIQKMKETSVAIRRDIVFAPSLYTTDEK